MSKRYRTTRLEDGTIMKRTTPALRAFFLVTVLFASGFLVVASHCLEGLEGLAGRAGSAFGLPGGFAGAQHRPARTGAKPAQPKPVAGADEKLLHFHEAAIAGKVSEAKALLDEPGFLQLSDKEGHTPLFAAACAGNVEVLDAVLAKESTANVNARDTRGGTPLFYAVVAGKSDAVKLLLSHGADANLPNQEGKTPLIVAVMMNQQESARLLLEARAKIDAQDTTGSTALLHAVQMGRFEMARLLVQHGANAEISNNNGLKPLEAAKEHADSKLVDLLQGELISRS